MQLFSYDDTAAEENRKTSLIDNFSRIHSFRNVVNLQSGTTPVRIQDIKLRDQFNTGGYTFSGLLRNYVQSTVHGVRPDRGTILRQHHPTIFQFSAR